jgi:hypothetical protein
VIQENQREEGRLSVEVHLRNMTRKCREYQPHGTTIPFRLRVHALDIKRDIKCKCKRKPCHVRILASISALILH